MAESFTLRASLEFRSLEIVREPIDFRLGKSSHPSAKKLDVNLSHQISDLIHYEDRHYLEPDKERHSPMESNPLYVGSLKPIIRYQLIRYSGRIQGRG